MNPCSLHDEDIMLSIITLNTCIRVCIDVFKIVYQLQFTFMPLIQNKCI